MRRSAFTSLVVVLAAAAAVTTACGASEDESPFTETDSQLIADYIRADNFRRLIFEVDYVPGLEPSETVKTELITGFGPLVDKPGGVHVVLDSQLPARGSDYAWSSGDLEDLARNNFDLEVQPDTIKIHVLFVDGHDERDDDEGQILGVAWGNQTIVLYKETLTNTCEVQAGSGLRKQGLVEAACEATERAIWTHELGHVIGLVNYGLPMVEDHEDLEHSRHDHNPECIMYWAFDRQQAFEEVSKKFLEDPGAVELGFDQACLNDIAEVRESD